MLCFHSFGPWVTLGATPTFGAGYRTGSALLQGRRCSKCGKVKLRYEGARL